MISVFKCRRTFVSIFSILALTVLGIVAKAEVAGAIATIAMALSGSNAAQAIFAYRGGKPSELAKQEVSK